MEIIFTLEDLQVLVMEHVASTGSGLGRDRRTCRKLFLTFGELSGFTRKELVLYANRHFPQRPVGGRSLVHSGLAEGRARYTA